MKRKNYTKLLSMLVIIFLLFFLMLHIFFFNNKTNKYYINMTKQDIMIENKLNPIKKINYINSISVYGFNKKRNGEILIDTLYSYKKINKNMINNILTKIYSNIPTNKLIKSQKITIKIVAPNYNTNKNVTLKNIKIDP